MTASTKREQAAIERSRALALREAKLYPVPNASEAVAPCTQAPAHVWGNYFTIGFGKHLQSIRERCKHCNAELERTPTKYERAKARREERLMNELHRVNRKLCKLIDAPDEAGTHVVGYDVMERVEAFAEKHPDDIRVIGVDDASFMSANLVLVDHDNSEQYWGTTVWLFTQSTAEPVQFFLYPGMRKDLMKALQAIDRKARKREIK